MLLHFIADLFRSDKFPKLDMVPESRIVLVDLGRVKR